MECKYLCRQISNQCIIAIAKVGYIFNSEQHDTLATNRKWMEKYGCCRIIEDSANQEKIHPEWKQLMDCLERGDELVISKFSNALRGVRKLAMFLEFCRVKVNRGKFSGPLVVNHFPSDSNSRWTPLPLAM